MVIFILASQRRESGISERLQGVFFSLTGIHHTFVSTEGKCYFAQFSFLYHSCACVYAPDDTLLIK